MIFDEQKSQGGINQKISTLPVMIKVRAGEIWNLKYTRNYQIILRHRLNNSKKHRCNTRSVIQDNSGVDKIIVKKQP